MTTPDPTYILPADVKARTRLSGLKALIDDDLNALITAAEDMIDAYVGPQKHHWKDDNVNRVFPREGDNNPEQKVNGIFVSNPDPMIPYQVSVACLRQVEFLYTQWWAGSDTDELPLQQDIESEDMGGDGSYSAKYVRGGLDISSATLAPQARALLDRFRTKFAGIDYSDPLSSAPVRPALTSDVAMPTDVNPYGYPV